MITQFKANDREDFITLSNEFYHTPGVLHSVPAVHFENTFDEIMKDSPLIKGYMIKADGRSVGYMQLSFTYSTEANGLVVLFEELYIRDEYQGQGLGKECFAFVENEFPQMKRLRLEVTHTNARAIGLYKKMGLDVLDYVQMIKDM